MTASSEQRPPSDGRQLVVGSTSAVAAHQSTLGSYGAVLPESKADELQQIMIAVLQGVVKRKWAVLVCIAIFTTLGLLRGLTVVPVYLAKVRLQIDRNVSKVVSAGDVTPTDNADVEFLRTQIELLKTIDLSERVVTNLRLGEDDEFLGARNVISGSAGQRIREAILGHRKTAEDATNVQRERTAIQVVTSNTSVTQVGVSRLFDVAFSDPSPERAQKIATAIAEAFIAANRDKRFQATNYAKSFLEDQIKQLKSKLETSEQTLIDFGRKEQIVQTNERASVTENSLQAANASLGQLAAERIRNEELWKQVEQAKSIQLPQFLSNPSIEGLRAQRRLLATDYQEKLETFKPAFPAMVQIKNKLSEIDRQLESEVQSIKASLKGAYESSLKQENELKKRVDDLRAEVLDLQDRSIQYNILKREVDSNRTLYNDLLQRFKEVDVAANVGTNNIFIVDRARVPTNSISLSPILATLIGTLAGLGVGLCVAYVLERTDDTVWGPKDIEGATQCPVIGLIPLVSEMELQVADLHSVVSEAYRSLCTSLQFTTDSGLPKSLFITSSRPGEGKSSTAYAVARHFAITGMKVLLIDADLRKPSLHTKLGLDNSIGLSNYLTGACTPPEAFQPTSVPTLTFMSSGPLPPNAADLLSSGRFLSLLSVGGEVFDAIVIDGPPVMGIADAPIIATSASATLFVVSAGLARRNQIVNAMRRLQLMRCPVVGTVLTRFNTQMAGYGSDYGYGYGYGNGYGYGAGYGVAQRDQPPALTEQRSEREPV